MPLFSDLPDDHPVTMCATFDWSELRPAEKALKRREVQARVASGDRPEKLVPLACSKGRFEMGRFVDEAGNVYRLRDVVTVLEEVPETRDDLRAFRRARAWEVGTAVTVTLMAPVFFVAPVTAVPLVITGPVYLSAGVVATNKNGTARAALARAVTTYNATTFWAEAEETYAATGGAVPTSVARATELVYAARGCETAPADARFKADAALVWGYAKQGYDGGALVQAAEAAPASAGCDLAVVIPTGLAEVAARRVVAEVE